MLTMNIPNLLTFFRISLIPIFVLFFYIPFQWSYWLTAIVFGIAALTDWLDGFLARKLEQVSPLGEFLDPVADKLMVTFALVLLVQAYPSFLMAIPAAVIVCREIAISALREWMSEMGKRSRVSVKWLGKLKTAAQMIAVLLLLSQNPTKLSWLTFLGFFCLYVAVLLTLWSMFVYLKAGYHELVTAECKNLPND